MSGEYRMRMWFVIFHSIFAVPAWSYLYVTEDFWVYGLFALANMALFGAAVGLLLSPRLLDKTDTP